VLPTSNNNRGTIMKRPYLVHETGNDTPRLVNASSQAAAIRHVVGSRFKAEAASASDVIQVMVTGVKPEEAGADPDDLASRGEG
jgi:hypothetical protein